MAKAVIIYGYYDEHDNFGKLLTKAKNALTNAGVHDIEVINSFAFTRQHLANNAADVSVDTAEWFRGHRTPANEALIKEQQDIILSATHLIFIYPIWWETVPPYLGTWISEVFRSVSFKISAEGKPLGQWGDNRQAMIVTTAGFSEKVRVENFKRSFPKGDSLTESEAKKQMERCQTYPISTALQYAGINQSQEIHISGVEKVNDKIAATVYSAVKVFVSPSKKTYHLRPRLQLQLPSQVVLFSTGAQLNRTKKTAQDDPPKKQKKKIKLG